MTDHAVQNRPLLQKLWHGPFCEAKDKVELAVFRYGGLPLKDVPFTSLGEVDYEALDTLITDVAPWRSMLDSCDSWSCQGCGHLFPTKSVETGWPPQREPR